MSSRSKKRAPRVKSRTAGKRAPKVDQHRRAIEAEKMLAKQWAYARIVDAIIKRFKCCERSAKEAIRTAYDRIADSDGQERAHRKRVMRETWRRQYEVCMAAGKLSAANRCLVELGRMDGLYEPTKIEVSGTIGVGLTQRMIIDALDEAGLDAFDKVMQQLERAGLFALPGGSPPPDGAEPEAGVIDVVEAAKP